MALGPGKYDDALSMAPLSVRGRTGILLILDGEQGSGFSCQANLAATMQLPALLRNVAASIERDLADGKI